MRVGQRNIDRLQRQRMRHLAPVGGNHVGRRRQTGRTAELGHHLAAGETFFGTAGVFGIGEDAVQIAGDAHRILEQPAAIGVQGDAGLGKALVQRADRLDLVLTAQHAALELEVFKAIACIGGFGQAHDGLRVHGFFMAQALPVVGLVGKALVGQVGQVAVADVKQIAQHLHRGALHAFAQ